MLRLDKRGGETAVCVLALILNKTFHRSDKKKNPAAIPAARAR
jgi:hypothetical protein